MSPRSNQVNDAMRERSRQALLDAALALFSERGVEGTSMEALARRAGVSKGLAYHYFDGKQALLEALVARRLQVVRELVAALPDDLPPRERLRQLLLALVEDARVHAAAHRLQLSVLSSPKGATAPVSEALRAERAAIAHALVELVHAAGSADPAAHAHLIKLLVAGVVLEQALAPSPPSPEPAVERLLLALQLHPEGGPR